MSIPSEEFPSGVSRSLRSVLGYFEKQTARKCEHLSEELRQSPVPISDDLLERICRLFSTRAYEVLRLHPGCDIDERIASVDSTLDIFNRSLHDLFHELERFSTHSQDSNFLTVNTESELHDIVSALRKEVYAISSSAAALVDHRKELVKVMAIPGYEERHETDFTSSNEHQFVIRLRNTLHHVSAIEGNWEIRSAGLNQTSHFVFGVDELLRYKKWNKLSISYIRNSGGKIDIAELFQSYGRRVNEFQEWVRLAVEANLPSDVLDYRRCCRAKKRRDAYQSYRMFLNVWLQNSVNPYEHLGKYLTPRQLQEVQALPMRSKEQVDRIISFTDEHGACDDEIRALVYQLFEVTDRETG